MILAPVIIYFHTIVLTICVKRSHGWEHADASKNSADESNLIIAPVYIDGMKNYNDKLFIHRELLKY